MTISAKDIEKFVIIIDNIEVSACSNQVFFFFSQLVITDRPQLKGEHAQPHRLRDRRIISTRKWSTFTVTQKDIMKLLIYKQGEWPNRELYIVEYLCYMLAILTSGLIHEAHKHLGVKAHSRRNCYHWSVEVYLFIKFDLYAILLVYFTNGWIPNQWLMLLQRNAINGWTKSRLLLSTLHPSTLNAIQFA